MVIGPKVQGEKNCKLNNMILTYQEHTREDHNGNEEEIEIHRSIHIETVLLLNHDYDVKKLDQMRFVGGLLVVLDYLEDNNFIKILHKNR